MVGAYECRVWPSGGAQVFGAPSTGGGRTCRTADTSFRPDDVSAVRQDPVATRPRPSLRCRPTRVAPGRTGQSEDRRRATGSTRWAPGPGRLREGRPAVTQPCHTCAADWVICRQIARCRAVHGAIRRRIARCRGVRPAAGPGRAQTLNRKRFNVIRRAIRLNRLRLHLCGPARGTVVQQSGAMRSNAAQPRRIDARPAPTPASLIPTRVVGLRTAPIGAPPPVRPTCPHVRNTGLATARLLARMRHACDLDKDQTATPTTVTPSPPPTITEEGDRMVGGA